MYGDISGIRKKKYANSFNFGLKIKNLGQNV